MDRVLWSDLTLEISNTLNTFYNKFLSDTSKSSAITNMVLMSMSIHNSSEDTVYYCSSTSFQKRLEYYAFQTIPILQTIQFENSDTGIIKIPDATDKVLKTFSGNNNGMTEIAPINANLGEVSTPNTKSKFSANNTQNEEFVNFEYEERRLKMAYSDYTNLCNYLHSVFVHLIVEYNTIY
jgi:hypothetical protein